MRTTLTLDDDVAAALKRLRKARDVGLKELVNDVLRRGLNEMNAPQKKRERFRTRSVALGRLRLSNVDNISEALAIARVNPSSDFGRRQHPGLFPCRVIHAAPNCAKLV